MQTTKNSHESSNVTVGVCARKRTQPTVAAKPPRTVIRGERNFEGIDSKLSAVFVDWLSFTWDETASWLPMESEIQALLSMWMGKKVQAQDNGKGGLGFKHTSSFWVSTNGTTATKIATFYRGGASQKGRVLLQIDGTGCSLIRDLREVQALIDSIGAKITRVDLAVDDYSGKQINVESAVQWHKDGLFSLTNKLPKVTCAGDWHMPEQGLGRTLYVGNRKNGKLCRIYEKGRQLGNFKSPWTRFECEILSRDRVIPSDVLRNPESYLAAQYPIAQTLLKQIGQRIKTIKNEVKASLEKAVKHAITQCGPLINYLATVLDFSDTSIVTLLKKEGQSPARLSKYAHSQVQNLAQFRVDILRGFSAKGV